MTELPQFRLETYFSKWEFSARYNFAASDIESMTVEQLMALAPESEKESLNKLWLGYTPTFGSEYLRSEIAATYSHCDAEQILCCCGAQEAIYSAMRVLLEKDDHAIVITPNYQSAETIPMSICRVSGVPLDPDNDWNLDVESVRKSIEPRTRLVSINFPHNPTGKMLKQNTLKALIDICRSAGLWLVSDEVYLPLLHSGYGSEYQVADLYEKGVSIGVMSKAYGLPGLRLGWIACRDKSLLQRLEQFKHYLSICCAGPSELLASIALKARNRILERNRKLVLANLDLLDAFFSRYGDLFSWKRPDGGCIAYPRYLGKDGVEKFAEHLLRSAGVLVLPASIYRSELNRTPEDRFRIGFGRKNVSEIIPLVEQHLKTQ